jgi:hypothetical protein
MSCSVAIIMAVALPPDLANGRDGDRNGAGTHGEAATGSNDRTSGTASLPARMARRGRRRRAASSSRRPPADHPSAVPVNRDASLFLAASPHLAFGRPRRPNLESASPDTGPSGRHASDAPAGFADSVGPLRAAPGGVPVRHNRHRSRSARGHSSCTRQPRSRTTRTRTDGQTPERSARHRRRGVDERRPRQDTRPACVLSGTVWGAAPGQNCQIPLGAVLTLHSGGPPPCCRGACCAVNPEAAAPRSHPPIPRRRAQMPTPRTDGLSHPDTSRPRERDDGTAGDNNRCARNEVSGSTQMSIPGSIRLSAEVGGVTLIRAFARN